MKHVIIYKQPDRYAGWPANYGIYSWGDEIVLGFTSGYHKPDGEFHARDKSKMFHNLQARSLDGGETWYVEDLPARIPGNRALSADEHMVPHLQVTHDLNGIHAPVPLESEVDFTHPDFALMCARSHLNAGAKSWFYFSTDRCHKWNGPYSLPMFGQKGVAARTDYIVSGKRECMLFLTATMDTEEGSRVFNARTLDGGISFEFVSWIGSEIKLGHHIMPASVRLSDSHILVATRERRIKEHWIDLYASNDNGQSWMYMNRPVTNTGQGGNPPTLTKLFDGRLCITYGYRKVPYGIRAKISENNGITWSKEKILRSDAGSFDIGYPRTIQRTDGTMVTAYYYNDQYGGACYIAATLWKP